jgi:hypothetical protein
LAHKGDGGQQIDDAVLVGLAIHGLPADRKEIVGVTQRAIFLLKIDARIHQTG